MKGQSRCVSVTTRKEGEEKGRGEKRETERQEGRRERRGEEGEKRGTEGGR